MTTYPPPMDEQRLKVLQGLAVHEARSSLWAFRRFIHPTMTTGPFFESLSDTLQKFFADYTAGLRPRLAISTPPQHGKSLGVIDAVAWVAGKNPDCRVIFASFSERLGVRANVAIQRILDSDRYKLVFPGTRLNSLSPLAGGAQAIRNRDILEYSGRAGYFRNTTARGPVTGESADILIGDDLIKGRIEANSATVRDNLWEWMTDDLMTRQSEGGAMLLVGTRWSTDDPIGRLRDKLGDKMRVVNYPAIGEDGEALFPELKSLTFLESQRTALGSASFEALYQGNPQIVGGNLIKGDWFPRWSQLPATLDYRIMVVDTALKAGVANDYTVAQVWGKAGGKIYLIDQWRAKVEAADLRTALLAFIAKHRATGPDDLLGQLRVVEIEDKASGTQLVQELKRLGGVPVKAIPRNKDKYTRYCDVAGYMEAGSVVLPAAGAFTHDLVAELEAFTHDDGHVHDDQVDCLIGACESIFTATSVADLWSRQT